MFKSKKKKQLEKQQRETEKAIAAANESVNKLKDYKLLDDDFKLSNDFRTSVILPQLNKQQPHANGMILESTPSYNSLPKMPTSPTSPVGDASKQYKELAHWRQQRSQNRYSNSLFGGKQRGKPKMNQLKKSFQSYDGDQETISENNTLVDEDLSITPSLTQFEQDKEEEEDFEFEEDEYEPDSDEENFFFKDFSKDSPAPKQPARRKRKSNKPSNNFNLSSFAKDLHDNRLSVIQPRQSTIVMTEDDEEELERLLHLQRQRMSMMTINESTDSLHIPPPPMPSLNTMKQYYSSGRESPISTIKDVSPKKETPPIHKKEQQPTPSSSSFLKRNGPILEKVSINKETTVKESSPPLHKAPSFNRKEPPQDPVPEPPPMQFESASLTPPSFLHKSPSFRKVDQDDRGSNKIALDDETPTIQRSISTTSIPKPTDRRKKESMQQKPPFTPTITESAPRPSRSYDQQQRQKAARKSISLDDIPFDTFDWIEESAKKQPPPAPPKTMSLKPTPHKSRGLFGSLRQVSRSKTTHHSGNHVNPIRGLVRNLSTATPPPTPPTPTLPSSNGSMSRAAMAVIQHNVSSQQDPTTSKPDIISQFISRASSTKIVNMKDSTKQKRNQVVRRTIIYVQPDSLHQLLKEGGDGVNIPPLPVHRNTVMSEASSLLQETATAEYITATKVSRQTSVRKKVGERGQLQSMGEDEIVPLPPVPTTTTITQRPSSSSSSESSSSSSSSSSNTSYMEGVELREMSDGSVMWGIVKKQGNRKSFYARVDDKKFEFVEEDADEEDGKPPPIPKRSPHRQQSIAKKAPLPPPPTTTTDVYYSNDVTLPNLLKLMQYPGDMQTYLNEKSMDSVDDQLDEMIKSISSQK